MNNEAYEFDNLYQEFQPKVFRYFARLVGDDDAQDLAQETMVKVSRGLDSFRGESTVSTWIYRIATNVLRDRFKSASFKRDSATMPLSGDMDSVEDEQVWSGERTRTIEEITIRKEASTWISGFIDGLPEEHRAALALKDIEGFKNQEIADILDISLDNVKIRLHRARSRLKTDLAAGCSFERDQENELTCEPKEQEE